MGTYAHHYTDGTPLTMLVDTSPGTVLYIGEALPGSLTTEPLWRIQKIDTSTSVISIQWAVGNQTFSNVWDDRATYAYS